MPKQYLHKETPPTPPVTLEVHDPEGGVEYTATGRLEQSPLMKYLLTKRPRPICVKKDK